MALSTTGFLFLQVPWMQNIAGWAKRSGQLVSLVDLVFHGSHDEFWVFAPNTSWVPKLNNDWLRPMMHCDYDNFLIPPCSLSELVCPWLIWFRNDSLEISHCLFNQSYFPIDSVCKILRLYASRCLRSIESMVGNLFLRRWGRSRLPLVVFLCTSAEMTNYRVHNIFF